MKNEAEALDQKAKQYKPASNHPWRRSPRADVVKWAQEKSVVSGVTTSKIGQLGKRGY